MLPQARYPPRVNVHLGRRYLNTPKCLFSNSSIKEVSFPPILLIVIESIK